MKKWINNNLDLIALIFFILGAVFLMLGFCKLDFFKDKDLFTASGSLFSAATILYAIYCYQADAREKNSKFYLEQIQKYFQGHSELNVNRSKFIPVTQNNIKWHQIIDSLKATEGLREKLTEKSHIEVYLIDYVHTAYSLIDIISKIDEYQFFFGIQYNAYKNAALLHVDTTLYNKASKNKISPERLYILACFIDRAARVSYDVNEKGTLITDCITKTYFKKIDKNYGEFTIFANVEIIREYIAAYKKCAEEDTKAGGPPHFVTRPNE